MVRKAREGEKNGRIGMEGRIFKNGGRVKEGVG